MEYNGTSSHLFRQDPWAVPTLRPRRALGDRKGHGVTSDDPVNQRQSGRKESSAAGRNALSSIAGICEEGDRRGRWEPGLDPGEDAVSKVVMQDQAYRPLLSAAGRCRAPRRIERGKSAILRA